MQIFEHHVQTVDQNCVNEYTTTYTHFRILMQILIDNYRWPCQKLIWMT